jgi:hypothetical protein
VISYDADAVTKDLMRVARAEPDAPFTSGWLASGATWKRSLVRTKYPDLNASSFRLSRDPTGTGFVSFPQRRVDGRT